MQQTSRLETYIASHILDTPLDTSLSEIQKADNILRQLNKQQLLANVLQGLSQLRATHGDQKLWKP